MRVNEKLVAVMEVIIRLKNPNKPIRQTARNLKCIVKKNECIDQLSNMKRPQKTLSVHRSVFMDKKTSII